MTLALLALLVLGATLFLGIVRTDLNVGLLGLAAAFAVGGWGAGLAPAEIARLFPSTLVLTVIGVSLLFGLAGGNGTLDVLTGGLLRAAGPSGQRLPLTFFGLAFALSALGPGNIAAVALLAPVALPAAVRAGVSPLLMAILLCTGANAGTFSPVAVTGSLNVTLLEGLGLNDPALPLTVFAGVAALQSLSAGLAYLLLGGLRVRAGAGGTADPPDVPPLTPVRRLTLAVLAAFLVLVVLLGVNAAAAAFVLASLLTLLRAGDAESAVRDLPWGVILLVGGIGTLVNLLEGTGSLDLATDLLARLAAPGLFHALLAFVAGLLSLGSSSSGVVMPLLVPLVPDLLHKVGAGSLVGGVIAVDVGSHMVDVSPLSTLGALCLAALPAEVDRARVFRLLLAWGLAMAVLGAGLAWVLLDLL
ncbi:Na+/H+ antiporter NhaD/arsenite permease-like protein [Deinococcus budaensis]|uniref:Na+/H+ antiporter NhaD/arsenite permease-like protein n=1 Tax=Deinococcus budaensis TaxID=1665626 RepID=A0A7W8LQC7_9DEIO|nr:SLC13 family permease [Deinococcus budaensis]MBB5234696.1 Na+/H+ antiporter NhaD/arsenite permease-like protein [Deinococcus budaensis]